MTISWLAIFACISVLAFLFFRRAPRSDTDAMKRLARLHGVSPMWGESDESVRERTTGAARWPYHKPEPKFVWWARGWRWMTGAAHAS